MSTKAAKPKSRLGRGLSSLIPGSDLPVEVDVSEQSAVVSERAGPSLQAGTIAPPSSLTTIDIPVEQITANPHQPRQSMDENGLVELAGSIRTTGVIQPVIVKRTDSGFQLIAGERRLRAAKLAGLETIPAIVRDVDSFTQAQMALVENIQREDLNPIDRALSYRALIEQLGLTQAELATRLGEDRTSVTNFLRLLDLSEPVRDLVRQAKLSIGHAKILAGVPDPVEQQRLAALVTSQDLSVRNLQRLTIEEPKEQPAPRSAPSAHVLDLEKSLSRQLGMRVRVRTGSRGRGRLVIHYATLDQFDELLERLGVTHE